MTKLLKNLEKDLNIETLKYAISKQIFCPYSENVLDYRNAILVTVTKGDKVEVKAIHGKYEDKVTAFTTEFEKLGCEVEVFVNVKTK